MIYVAWQKNLPVAVRASKEELVKVESEFIVFDKITEESFAKMYNGIIYLDPNKLKEVQSETVRAWRNELFKETSWLLERHNEENKLSRVATLDDFQYNELLNYRQSLRDIPSQPGFPWKGNVDLVPWPIKPSFIK